MKAREGACMSRQLGWGKVPADSAYHVKDVQNCESIPSIFQRISRLYPDSTALHALCEGVVTTKDKGRYLTYTYRELDRITSAAAANIRSRSKQIRSFSDNAVPYICICVHEGSSLVVANLAVLKAGAALVPVSPFEPASRLRKIVADIRPVMVR